MGGVSGFLEAFRNANQSGVDFLLADLDLAITFMNVAQVSSNHETVLRNRYRAHTAYCTTLHLIEKAEAGYSATASDGGEAGTLENAPVGRRISVSKRDVPPRLSALSPGDRRARRSDPD